MPRRHSKRGGPSLLTITSRKCASGQPTRSLSSPNDVRIVPLIHRVVLVLSCLVLVGSYYVYDNPTAINGDLASYFGVPFCARRGSAEHLLYNEIATAWESHCRSVLCYAIPCRTNTSPRIAPRMRSQNRSITPKNSRCCTRSTRGPTSSCPSSAGGSSTASARGRCSSSSSASSPAARRCSPSASK